MPQDDEIIAGYSERKLQLATARLGDEYFYQSLPLCVIDAVWSIGVKYESVRRVVERYCNRSNLRKIRSDRHSMPPKPEQETIEAFCARVGTTRPEKLAKNLFENRQRTSTRNGILKAEAVCRFAQVLQAHGVDCFQDGIQAMNSSALERDIRCIRGQRSGTSLTYFWMLAGSEEFIKPDRMVCRFLESALKRCIRSEEALQLLQRATIRLQESYPHLTPRLLDHEIWKYERGESTERSCRRRLS